MPVQTDVLNSSREDRRPLFDGLPDLLTAQDVCDLTGASLQTVRRRTDSRRPHRSEVVRPPNQIRRLL